MTCEKRHNGRLDRHVAEMRRNDLREARDGRRAPPPLPGGPHRDPRRTRRARRRADPCRVRRARRDEGRSLRRASPRRSTRASRRRASAPTRLLPLRRPEKGDPRDPIGPRRRPVRRRSLAAQTAPAPSASRRRPAHALRRDGARPRAQPRHRDRARVVPHRGRVGPPGRRLVRPDLPARRAVPQPHGPGQLAPLGRDPTGEISPSPKASRARRASERSSRPAAR